MPTNEYWIVMRSTDGRLIFTSTYGVVHNDDNSAKADQEAMLALADRMKTRVRVERQYESDKSRSYHEKRIEKKKNE